MKLGQIDIGSLIDDDFIWHHQVIYWGEEILIMEKSGGGVGRVYTFNDDPSTVFLDCLSVSENMRKKGIGKRLQEMRESLGRDIGAKHSFLFVLKDSWMHQWYKRRGYEDSEDLRDIYGISTDDIWMRKIL